MQHGKQYQADMVRLGRFELRETAMTVEAPGLGLRPRCPSRTRRSCQLLCAVVHTHFTFADELVENPLTGRPEAETLPVRLPIIGPGTAQAGDDEYPHLRAYLPLSSTSEHSTAGKAVASRYSLKPDQSAIRRTHVTFKLSSKLSSGSGGVWFLMYSTHISSVTLPLLATQ
jgi:hypothetical protein